MDENQSGWDATQGPVPETPRGAAWRIALFAADEVGLRVAQYMASQKSPPACLVLSPADPNGRNAAIRQASGLPAERIFDGRQLLESASLDRFRELRTDLGVLAWWPHILRTPLLEATKAGFLNFHPSLLPHNRGKDPNYWAIVEQVDYGVSLHWVDRDVDAGPIAFQQTIDVAWDDTGQTLYEKAKVCIVELFKRHFDDIMAGSIPRHPQPCSAKPARRRRELEAASTLQLDAVTTARDLLNQLRAKTFPPHRGCQFDERGKTYEVRVCIRPIDTAG